MRSSVKQPNLGQPDKESEIIWLHDGSMMALEAMNSKNGHLTGRSSLYGEVSVPVEAIKKVILAPQKNSAAIPHKYGDWMIQSEH